MANAQRQPKYETLDSNKQPVMIRLAPDIIKELKRQAGTTGISVPALIRLKLTAEIRG